jgi:phosphoadenosine phosphosulfate reductase
MNALETRKVIHIYGDTTLEYPTTGEYIKKFKNENPETPMLVAKNKDQEFNNLCEVVGPPSRVMRWCCTVFKTGAITKKIEQSFKEKKSILTFYGIRRSESYSRSKYDRESDSPKISKQLVVSPIIDWFDADVWLYILANKISFNDAYKQGFSRVGCWCCPNNSLWSEYLSGIYMSSQYNTFKDILYKFAKKVGKEDWKEYIDTGKWRARQGGNGLEYSKRAIINFKPCVLEEDSYNFDLIRPIDDNLYNLFVPFGRVDFSLGNKRLGEVYIISNHTKKPILKLSGRTGTFTLKITVLERVGVFKIPKFTESYLKNQLTKYQTCIACSACQSVCKFNAIRIFNELPGQVSNSTINYCIDANKCVNCLECVTHFDGGCYMKKVLRTKKDSYHEEIKS